VCVSWSAILFCADDTRLCAFVIVDGIETQGGQCNVCSLTQILYLLSAMDGAHMR
jgi:hypothetical protein